MSPFPLPVNSIAAVLYMCTCLVYSAATITTNVPLGINKVSIHSFIMNTVRVWASLFMVSSVFYLKKCVSCQTKLPELHLPLYTSPVNQRRATCLCSLFYFERGCKAFILLACVQHWKVSSDCHAALSNVHVFCCCF